MSHSTSRSRRILAVLAGAVAAVGFAAAPPVASVPAPPAPISKPLSPTHFQRWPDRAPAVALILSGEQHSYIKFCGCSSPQLGGFERRYNLMAMLKEKGWPVAALDLGDLVKRPEKGPFLQAQNLLKYKAEMQLLGILGYPAIGLGANDFNLPLLEGMAIYTLQNPDANPKVLSANLADRNVNFPDPTGKGSMIGGAILLPPDANRPTIGAVAVVAPSVQDKVKDKALKFTDYKSVVTNALKQLEENKVELKVLLFQGLPREAAAAAKEFPQFQVILCCSEQEEPPGNPTVVGDTQIVQVGWRGRYVGVLGAFATGNAAKPFEFHYQIVPLGEEFETDKDREKDHPVLATLEDYSKAVRDQNLLVKYSKQPHPTQINRKGKRITFVGSEACRTCHVEETAKWQASKHSHAFDALTTYAKKPSLRQFDGECVVCHTIGFEYATGYIDERRTPNLKHVGCENCHGPGSLHAAEPFNRDYRADMSPWKTAPTDRLQRPDGKYDDKMVLKIHDMCHKCHDTDNDPKFKLEQYWPQIEHGKKPTAPAK